MTKTDREIELEKKLSIAVKALRYYANSNCWDDCFYNGRIKVSAYALGLFSHGGKILCFATFRKRPAQH